MQDEKIIREYEDYKVFTDGRIYGLKRHHFLTPVKCSTGYYVVNLYNENGPKTFLVHQLVANAFLEKPIGRYITVDHISRDKSDNSVNNLEWKEFDENLKNKLSKYQQYVEQLPEDALHLVTYRGQELKQTIYISQQNHELYQKMTENKYKKLYFRRQGNKLYCRTRWINNNRLVAMSYDLLFGEI